MSKIAFYLVAGAGVLLVGGVTVWLVGVAMVQKEVVHEAEFAARREFAIEGMHCQGCADSITTALAAIPGVQSARVSFADKRAVVLAKESDVPTEELLAAITAVGYQARAENAARAPAQRATAN
jgi:copper chaperone CopZ